jgi:biotin carboxyl carrier protein
MPGNEKTYKVLINGFAFFFTQAELDAVDMTATDNTSLNLITDHRSINARIVNKDISHKKLTVAIAGESFDVVIKDELDQLLEQMGLSAAPVKQLKDIKAPMPGLVLEIAIQEGQQVQEGDKILILEAMKMENSIVINRAATIKKILVKAGQAVEKGQVLVELD